MSKRFKKYKFIAYQQLLKNFFIDDVDLIKFEYINNKLVWPKGLIRVGYGQYVIDEPKQTNEKELIEVFYRIKNGTLASFNKHGIDIMSLANYKGYEFLKGAKKIKISHDLLNLKGEVVDFGEGIESVPAGKHYIRMNGIIVKYEEEK